MLDFCNSSGKGNLGHKRTFMPPSQVSQLIRFDNFELDIRAGELRNGGIRIRLQEQPLLILQALLENPGQVVTREELQKKIWPADTFVDFDHGLHAAVNRLRAALNDSADRPLCRNCRAARIPFYWQVG